MRQTNLFSVSLGILALASSAGAQAAEAKADCISEQEISAIVVYVMPQLVAAAQKGCAGELSPTGFFATGGAAMSQRYAETADAAWPLARSAFIKFGGGSKDREMREMVTLPDAALRPLLDAVLEQKVAEEIKPKSCHDIERLAEVVNAIEPGTTGALIGVVAALAIGDKDKPRVCEAVRS